MTDNKTAMKKFVYKNPIAVDTIKNIRDPFIISDNGCYYLTGTFPPYWTGENDGVMLYKSPDLLSWEKVGCILPQSSSDGKWFRDYWWAPEIHKKGNKFYLTVNCRNEDLGIGQNPVIAVSDKIDGEYTVLNPDKPLFTESMSDALHSKDVHGNDANLFTDDDGKTYISFCNFGGIWAYEIELDSCTLIGEPILLVEHSKEGWDTKNEGPFVIKHNGKYYCFYSSFTRSYEVGVASADSMRGEWIKDEHNPIITPRKPFIHSGHNSVFTGVDGKLWTAYHITLEGRDGVHLLAIDPIDFDEEDNIITSAPTCDEMTIEY